MSIKSFFKEDNGNFSMTRLTTFLLVVTGILLSFLGGYMVFVGKLITELTYLIIALLGFGVGSKVGQKFAELQIENKENK